MLVLFAFFVAASLAAECPPEGNIFYYLPHETDCTKFYICAHGVPVLQTCPDGTHFSPMHNVCQNPIFAGCDNTRPDLCPDWNMLPKPHPESCSKFYVCEYGTAQVFDCPSGLEFNSKLLQCVWPNESDCKLATEGAQTEAEVPQNGENVQVPEHIEEQVDEQVGGQVGCKDGELFANVDCGKYNICSHGALVAADCPAGLHWNSELAFCDWPASAGCVPKYR